MTYEVFYVLYDCITYTKVTLFIISMLITIIYAIYGYYMITQYTDCQLQSIKYAYLSIYNLTWLHGMLPKSSGIVRSCLAVD